MKRLAQSLALFALLFFAASAHAQFLTPGTQTKIDFALTGDNTVVAAVTGKPIRIIAMVIVVSADTAITMKDGTGTALTGAMSLLANGAVVLDPATMPWFVTSAGNGFVINQSGTAQISGRIYYTVGP